MIDSLTASPCQILKLKTTLFFHRHAFVFGHVVSKLIIPVFFNHLNTRIPVRSEDEGKHLAHKIVVLFTITNIVKFLTVSTAKIIIFHTADPNLTPGSFFIFLTTRAFFT